MLEKKFKRGGAKACSLGYRHGLGFGGF